MWVRESTILMYKQLGSLVSTPPWSHHSLHLTTVSSLTRSLRRFILFSFIFRWSIPPRLSCFFLFFYLLVFFFFSSPSFFRHSLVSPESTHMSTVRDDLYGRSPIFTQYSHYSVRRTVDLRNQVGVQRWTHTVELSKSRVSIHLLKETKNRGSSRCKRIHPVPSMKNRCIYFGPLRCQV